MDRERLFQELLDGTLSAERREAAILELRADPQRAAELVRLRAALDSMRDDGQRAPDISPAILAELGRRRGFLARSMRVAGTVARVAAVVGIIGTLGALALVREKSEGMLSPEQPAPMTQVVDAVETELGGCVRTLTYEARVFGNGISDMPESARRFALRLAQTPRPLAIEAEGESRILTLTWEVKPEQVLVSGGRVAMFEPFDVRVHLEGAVFDRDAQPMGHAIWVVGSGSRWASSARYPWAVAQPVRHGERKSSFGLGKDAGYP